MTVIKDTFRLDKFDTFGHRTSVFCSYRVNYSVFVVVKATTPYKIQWGLLAKIFFRIFRTCIDNLKLSNYDSFQLVYWSTTSFTKYSLTSDTEHLYCFLYTSLLYIFKYPVFSKLAHRCENLYFCHQGIHKL